MYEVISAFYDLTDCIKTKSGPIYHRYVVGDTYPRDGVMPSEERVTELLTGNNRLGRPLIRPLGEAKTEPAGNDGAEANANPKKRRKPSGKGKTG